MSKHFLSFENFITSNGKSISFKNITYKDLKDFSFLLHSLDEDIQIFDFFFTINDKIKLNIDNILLDNLIELVETHFNTMTFTEIKITKKYSCKKIKSKKYKKNIKRNVVEFYSVLNKEIKTIVNDMTLVECKKVFKKKYDYPKNVKVADYRIFLKSVINAFLKLLFKGVKIGEFTKDIKHDELIYYISDLCLKNEIEFDTADFKLIKDESTDFILDKDNLNEIIKYLKNFGNLEFDDAEILHYGNIKDKLSFRSNTTILELLITNQSITEYDYLKILLYALLLNKSKNIKTYELTLFNPLIGEEHVIYFNEFFRYDNLELSISFEEVDVDDNGYDVLFVKNDYLYYQIKPEAQGEIFTIEKILEKLDTSLFSFDKIDKNNSDLEIENSNFDDDYF